MSVFFVERSRVTLRRLSSQVAPATAVRRVDQTSFLCQRKLNHGDQLPAFGKAQAHATGLPTVCYDANARWVARGTIVVSQ